jgi:hypothetical protein
MAAVDMVLGGEAGSQSWQMLSAPMSSTKRASMAAFSASVAVAFFICRSPASACIVIVVVVVVVVSVDPWWRRLESRISGERRAYLLMAAEAHGASLVSWVIWSPFLN